MYFGDEDPGLLADSHKTLLSNLPCSPEEPILNDPESHWQGNIEPHPQEMGAVETESDLVLMYSEAEGSFEYSSGGANVSGSSHDFSREGAGMEDQAMVYIHTYYSYHESLDIMSKCHQNPMSYFGILCVLCGTHSHPGG